MSDFYVGQEVVCVNGAGSNWPAWSIAYTFPKAGCHYVIRDIGPSYRGGDELCVRLVEIVNGAHRGGDEINFRVSRFAPIKTDTIQIFREMCRTVKRDVDA